MGRKKLVMRRIENATSRQVTFSKRKDSMVKKANELSILCDTDVALIMFSPTDQVTSFASNGRVEDIFLRFVDRPDELKGGPIWNEEYLSQRLKQLKNEGVMLDKIATIEALEEKLDQLNRQKREAQEKMRYYDPNVEKISSVFEAGVYQQSLTSAMQRIELSKEAKLRGKRVAPPSPEGLEEAAVDMEDAASLTDESADPNETRNRSRDEHHHDSCSPKGPHLSLSFIQSQKNWNLSGGEQAPKLNIM